MTPTTTSLFRFLMSGGTPMRDVSGYVTACVEYMGKEDDDDVPTSFVDFFDMFYTHYEKLGAVSVGGTALREQRQKELFRVWRDACIALHPEQNTFLGPYKICRFMMDHETVMSEKNAEKFMRGENPIWADIFCNP